MIATLYKEVFGDSAPLPQEAELQALATAISYLPESICSVMVRHYIWKEPIETVAREMGNTVFLIERWRQSGIAILRIWLEGQGEATKLYNNSAGESRPI